MPEPAAATTLPAGPAAGAAPFTTGKPPESPEWVTQAPIGADLDVRPMLERREEPFGAIMAAARQVPAGQLLRLRSSFEPFPLYHVLGNQGFAHWARQLAPGDWEVLFYRPPAEVPAAEGISSGGTRERGAAPAPGPSGAPADGGASSGGEWPTPSATVTIDVSDLVPPEPMIRILEALEQLDPGQALRVNHVRRPVYLYARLDELGYLHETRELGPNQVELRILKPAK